MLMPPAFVFLKGFLEKNLAERYYKQAGFVFGGYPLAFLRLLGKIKKFGEWGL